MWKLSENGLFAERGLLEEVIVHFCLLFFNVLIHTIAQTYAGMGQSLGSLAASISFKIIFHAVPVVFFSTPILIFAFIVFSYILFNYSFTWTVIFMSYNDSAPQTLFSLNLQLKLSSLS